MFRLSFLTLLLYAAAVTACDNADGGSPAVVTNDTASVDISSDSKGDADATVDASGDVAPDTADVADSAEVADTADTADVAPDVIADAPDATADVPADATTAAVGWTLFRINKGAGPCPPGSNCTWSWTLDTNGALTIAKQGVPSSAQLSAADWTKVNQVLSSSAFLKLMQSGFTCGQPPTDIGVSFDLALFGVMLKQDVTGCIFGQPADNLALPVYQALTAY